MSPGDLLLKLAFVAALASTALFWPALRGRRAPFATSVYITHAAALLVAMALLWSYFLGHRFEYEYVAQFSSRALSPALTFAASWAGQEGSILLWTTLVGLLGVALLFQPGALARPAMAFVSATQTLLLVLLMVKSPFRLNAVVPPDGQGLNPLLEDPWMVAHPPILFLGYAAAAIPFALALTALVRHEYREWQRVTWPWVLFVVVTLGAGIVLGGVWAYRVLGWGGYWGWDPVENASLIPWLMGVALIHGLLIQRTTDSLVRTNLVLAALGWITVVGGTWLTRSGVLQDFSVHSFADSGLNIPLGGLALASIAVPLVLLARRWMSIPAPATQFASVSREAALWLGLITVVLLAVLVAFGTWAPVLTGIAGKPSSVQPTFYTMVSVPLGIALVILMAVAPALRWSRQSGLSWLTALLPGLVCALLGLIGGAVAGMRDVSRLALLATTGMALGTNVVWMVRLFRRGWSYGSGYLGHVGIGVMVLGMVISSTFGRSERTQLAPGTPARALQYDLLWESDRVDARGEHVLAITASDGKKSLKMEPRMLGLPRDEQKLRKPALAENGELYLSVLDIVQSEGHGEPVWLVKNQETVVGGTGYTFTGFRMESHENMQVLADIRVRRGEQTTMVSPGMAAGAEGTKPLDVLHPELGNFHVARIDADRGRIAVVLPGAASPAVAIVELSTKPMVNLVWIGAVMALIGSVMAGLRRAAERAPARAARAVRQRAVPA